MRLDVLFVCDAHADTGLGHGSRCAHLARIIMQRNPQTEMAFQGTFSDGAKDFMSKLAPGVPFLAPEQGVAARTSFVDRMADTQDAEAWSEEVVARMTKTCGRVVYMVSGVTLPPVPKGVICIGYQPSDVVSAPPHVLWGLEYAPTHKEVDDDRERDVPREQCRVLLALGGARDDKALLLVLAALSSIEIITDIDLLGTPVNAPMASDYPLGQHQNLHRHENGEQLPYLLKRSGMVIASFGNLGYEALAAGAPLCLIGQKQFQADLAGLFQKCGLAISAGLAANSSKETIACAVRKTLDEADMLSQTAKRMIDGQGLYRIADIIAPTRGGGVRAVKHMRVVAIVQARMGSTRLPGKVLMPLAGEPMLARIVRRISTARHLDAVVVATSTQPQDDAVFAQCKDLNVPCHRGSEKNVLERFLDVAQAYDADVIVRLTGDNPMVDGALVDFVVNGFCEADPEVVYANNVDESGFPFGLYVEVVDAGALRDASADSSPENCEHVTWHIRQHPERYAQATIKAPGVFPNKAMSIDTAEDYEKVSAIFEKYFHKNPDFSFRDLMED